MLQHKFKFKKFYFKHSIELVLVKLLKYCLFFLATVRKKMKFVK